MRRYHYRPANLLEQIGHGPTGSLLGRAGDVVQLDDERRDRYLATVAGADGPCLVPEAPAVIDEPAPIEAVAVEPEPVSPVSDPAPAPKRTRRSRS